MNTALTGGRIGLVAEIETSSLMSASRQIARGPEAKYGRSHRPIRWRHGVATESLFRGEQAAGSPATTKGRHAGVERGDRRSV